MSNISPEVFANFHPSDPEPAKVRRSPTDRCYATGCVHELFEKCVAQRPRAVALIQGDRRLTYADLNEQANRIAHSLQKRGVGPEVFVGLCMNQSLEAIAAVMGILKAGGAYVPLDPHAPLLRVREVAEDAGLELAVTSARLRDRIPPHIETVCLDRDAKEIAAERSSTPASGASPDNAAYVLYTSGSTGGPKGVVGIHRSITNGLHSVSYAPDEVCCLNASLLFGFSLANLFLPLIQGVPLVVLSDEQLKDIYRMVDVLEREAVTRIALGPPVFKQILSLGPRIVSKLKSIRTIGVAGSELTPDLLQTFMRWMPWAKLHNCYSSTEIGTLATNWDVTEESLALGEVFVGQPVANTRIHILDSQMQPVPPGRAGDLYVGAHHLARGYLNRPALTAERFVPDPFSASPGSRLFATGDRGRIHSNGELQFLGRADDLVKIRGFRIELAEVERAVASHIGVREAAVAVKPIGGDQRLVAYLVANDIGAPNTNQMRNHLRERLPDYMIPASFVYLDRLPLGGNGKVDRGRLPQPDPVRPSLDTQYEEPRDSLEVAVAEIWSDLLGLAPIGIHDHFLELGGDSLLAAQIASRVWDRFGLEMSQQSLYDRPTIAELAAHIRSQSDDPCPEADPSDPIQQAAPESSLRGEIGAMERNVFTGSYRVVVNNEEQYSLSLESQPVPPGWQLATVPGKKLRGTRQECLDHIERMWTDLRPLSVRRLLHEVSSVARAE